MGTIIFKTCTVRINPENLHILVSSRSSSVITDAVNKDKSCLVVYQMSIKRTVEMTAVTRIRLNEYSYRITNLYIEAEFILIFVLKNVLDIDKNPKKSVFRVSPKNLNKMLSLGIFVA